MLAMSTRMSEAITLVSELARTDIKIISVGVADIRESIQGLPYDEMFPQFG
jgi:hypothetical protein